MIGCQDASISYTGRFSLYEGAMTATTSGAQIKIAFKGDTIRLLFDVKTNERTMPHLWLVLDGGAKVEVPLDAFLRLETTPGEHILEVIFKGSVETQPRFCHPLVGKISFLGYDLAEPGTLPEDNRKTIEFVGDSITEGVLIDAQTGEYGNAVCQSHATDATATYGWIAAEELGLRHYHMGYGYVGVTHLGNGGVPLVQEAYPWCFQDAPIAYHPDYVVINIGTNDREAPAEEFYAGYWKLLDAIRTCHPDAKIFSLCPFIQGHVSTQKKLIADYNREKGENILFIPTEGWLPPSPVHPLRQSHRYAGERLAEELRKIL